ncbi:tetratricopeptide repeat protein [Trichocoleus desertorum GB2-A4]|uniref:Tetratricopeptide repeat protein n=1 Tax=Trichocoleus desertorum GB2-A4 TaxID=2933944 RepID=A0ABV0J1Y3_9CYAN
MVQLADRHSPLLRMTGPNQTSSHLNRQSYQRLKRALSLHLRRQIFVAVCDDLALRNRLAARLHAELAYPAASTTTRHPEEAGLASDYPRLVTLNLNLNDPNPIAQVTQWLARHPLPKGSGTEPPTPSFQILGTERLTRQSAAVQRLFLSYLQGCDRSLPTLEASLLLWVPHPWFRAIQQSAPEFWGWRTGVFEFVGEPTPLSVVSEQPKRRHSDQVALTHQPTPKRPQPAIVSTSDVAHPPVTPANQKPVDVPISLRDLLADELAFGDLVDDLETTVAPANTTESTGDRLTADLGSPPPNSWSVHVPTAAAPTNQVTANSLPARSGFHSESPASEPQPLRTVATEPQSPSITAPAANSSELDNAPTEAPLPSIAPELVNLVLTAAIQEIGGATALRANAPVPSLSRLSATLPAPLVAALEDFPPLRMLRHLEQLHQQQAETTGLAVTYRTLGNFYRDRIEQGHNSPQQLAIAIQAYEQALIHLEESSALVPDILNDLGNLYWMLSRFPPNPEQRLPYLEQGIAAYHLALTQVSSEQQPQSYAMIQNNLGAAYGDLARYREPIENLQCSITAYEEALRHRKPDVEPLKYASTQNNLGTAYWHLAQHHQPALHLKQAIVAYTESLSFYNPEQEPLHYAMIQNNLGTAYWNLAQHEQPEEFLNLAISCYRIALIYRTVEVNPAAYAATQNNLGTAYWHLASRSKEQPEAQQQALRSAIVAYEAALAIVEQINQTPNGAGAKLTFDVFATHNNLGLAHYQVATDQAGAIPVPAKSAHLEASLRHHLQALQGWQHQPDFYQTALGYVLQTVRAFYSECGLQGQNLALSLLPGHLLPEILPRL